MIRTITTISLFAVLLLTVSACVKPGEHQQRGRPESLLDYSSERVTFGLAAPSAIDDIVGWVNRDQPSRAELSCDITNAVCSQVETILNQFGVRFENKPSKDGGNSVVLIYDRIVARDCDSRYVDNHINYSNLNHPTFGCSVAVNSVQMVTDRSVFKSPALMDPQDAEKTVSVLNKYYAPKPSCGCPMMKAQAEQDKPKKSSSKKSSPKEPPCMCPMMGEKAEAAKVAEPSPNAEHTSAPEALPASTIPDAPAPK